MYFEDRRTAGRRLAARLDTYAGRTDLLVLALPRGGVPVAYAVARTLDAATGHPSRRGRAPTIGTSPASARFRGRSGSRHRGPPRRRPRTSGRHRLGAGERP